MELSTGAIDCIWNGFTMNSREDDYTWSDPYIDNSQVFVVAADSGIENKSDLAGKVVAVQKDSSALAALNDEIRTILHLEIHSHSLLSMLIIIQHLWILSREQWRLLLLISVLHSIRLIKEKRALM